LGYEYETAMIGNPLISWESRSAAGTSTFAVDTAFFVLFVTAYAPRLPISIYEPLAAVTAYCGLG